MVCLKLLCFACLFAVSFAGFPRKLRYQSDEVKDLQLRSALGGLPLVSRFASQYQDLNKLAVKYAIFKLSSSGSGNIYVVPVVISGKIETKTTKKDKKWYKIMLSKLSDTKPRYVVFKSSISVAGGLPFHFVSVTNWLPKIHNKVLRDRYEENFDEFKKIFEDQIKGILTYTAEDWENMAYE